MSSAGLYKTSPEGMAALQASIRKAHGMYMPPPILTLSEWSDRYAYIPKESGAFPGKFSTSFAEYQRGIQDAITDPNIETVVQMLCSQSGKSQIQLNTIGYFTHHDPSPILVIQASEGEAEKFSKNRIAKMIRDTPVLRDIYPKPRARDSGNTLLNKEFAGGVLVIAGANAPAGLASMPIRILMPDEVDRYPESAGTEGDPVDLAEKRTTTYWNRKIILASTPGVKGVSRIEAAYNASDKRKYYVPCPHCGVYQVLDWRRFQYSAEEDGGERARLKDFWYVCDPNGCEIREKSKFEMIRRGEWQATARSQDGRTAGFQLNALYSPVLGWGKMANEWVQAQTSLERMKTFVNTRLAETWEIRGTGADLHELEKRKDSEDYADLLPAGVLFLTAGVDVQDNRLEVSVLGWGLDDERWVIDHRIFEGDPSKPETDEESPWGKVREYLLQPFEHALGVSTTISCALIDSGGHHTSRVYEFSRKHELRRWHAIVGRAGIGKALVSKGSEQGPEKTKLFTVGVDTAKEDIFTSFRAGATGPGSCHFTSTLPAEYFRQLTSEQLVKVKRDFVTTLKWVKKFDRNEALDCFVYARAAVAVLRPNFRKIRKNLLRAVEKAEAERARQADMPELESKPEAAPELVPQQPKESDAPRRRVIKVRGRSFATGKRF